MQFYRDVFDGKPFMRKVVQLLPLRKDGKPRTKPYVEFDVPVYPTLDQRLEAAERLEVRGWGKAKQDVVIDDIGGGGGFKLVYRRWPVGVDPAAEPPPGERIITGTAKALPGGFSSDERSVGGPRPPSEPRNVDRMTADRREAEAGRGGERGRDAGLHHGL